MIFRPFKRAVNMSDYEGSGIGLATVKKIIQMHDGKITAKGEEGAGATFTLTLPRKRA